MAKQDRAVRTRQELIRSAATAFDRSGYALSSLTEISRGAGVSSGALHFHFSSKQALGSAVEESAAQSLGDIIALPPREHPAPLRHLVDTSHVLARRLDEDVVLRAGFGLAADATWMGDVTLWRTWRSWVRTTLTRARHEAALSPDVPIEDAVSAVTAAVVGAQALGRFDVEWSPEYALTQFWNLMLPRISAMAPAE
ncbi:MULTISPECIES: ScbR family autoregulator-binding transcription factor [unclassified Streptomyces]|uniref:ScbR family autoregulator-binding transcription factor n=1 Tax=unclassified Streptomyces TaxID=2593676 RepID=UPI0001C1B111|nr:MULTISPECIES: ScbR family autoregulator-binding transcription factor [unclassified Streptomyces]AEN11041.1 transcriptional regulator, TetR family [Streptomyces sp. SirexAA-E]MYR65929.1 TetR family transcriptional regulator [Streptomyces sp. SID4939]MYR99062.1 TetR family transcriptional regulator [Streptomyces sp. SID4940]MYT63692.1 TetR family transcriptional regulator [Streptomyces sp. SID8357]MYT85942.1 TetR family transcriptional regulator [Streptomyces sp. SID8360]